MDKERSYTATGIAAVKSEHNQVITTSFQVIAREVDIGRSCEYQTLGL